MKLLKKLKEEDWGANKNRLPASYSNSSWGDLHPKQQNKTVAFWYNLTEDVQTVQLATAAALTKAKNAAPHTEAKGRSPNTTADDMCRLLHVMFDPTNAGLRTKLTQGSLKRADLEANKNEEDPWAALAANFNNYVNFKYQNEAVKYDAEGKKLHPFQARTPAFTKIAAKSYELDPTAEDRPMRDGAWMKEKWYNNAHLTEGDRRMPERSTRSAALNALPMTGEGPFLHHLETKWTPDRPAYSAFFISRGGCTNTGLERFGLGAL